MATKTEILEALAAESGPITVSALAEKMAVETSQLTTQISRLLKSGQVVKNEVGEVLLAEKGHDELTASSEVEVGATDFDYFKSLGKKIGVVGDIIDVTTNHVWAGGDYRDLTWVWRALGEMAIRQDLKGRWWNAWRSFLKQGVPPELRDEVSGITDLGKDEGPPGKKTGRDYIIVDDEPVRVGEGLGDYGLQDAKDLLAIRALRDRARGSSTTERRPDVAHTDNVAGIITALQPFLTKGTDTDMLKEMLGDKMQLLKSDIIAGMPRSSDQPKSWIDQLGELTGLVGKLKEAGPIVRSILGLPEGGGNPNPSANPVTLPFTDKDGNPMQITADPETGIQWLRFLGEEKRADEKQGMLRGMVETFKEEAPAVIGALKEVAEGYNKKAGQGGRGPETVHTESAAGGPPEAGEPQEATCPSCQQSFPMTGISPEGDITCPHCNAILTAE